MYSCRPFALLLAAVALVTTCVGTSFDLGMEDLRIVARQRRSSCTNIRIPRNMCTACKLKPFTVEGNKVDFHGQNRFDIYDLSTPGCQRHLRSYAAMNPCDEPRVRALNRLNNTFEQQAMVYFMYSVCETCCDCIPIGARVDQYDERKANGTLINIFRGNCAAHFRYDTCAIWPQASHITGPFGKIFDDRRGWCPDFLEWQASENSRGWIKNNNVDGVTNDMRRGMRQITRKARCAERTQWSNCIGMELAQGRV